VPFGGPRKRLGVLWKDENDAKRFAPRWFNDTGDRLERAMAAGYEFVNREEVRGVGDPDVSGGNTDMSSRVSRVVGLDATGQPARAYLMKLDLELYEEDQGLKEEVNAQVDTAVRGGTAGGASVESSYGGVRLNRD
jgi:hypothetical protein